MDKKLPQLAELLVIEFDHLPHQRHLSIFRQMFEECSQNLGGVVA